MSKPKVKVGLNKRQYSALVALADRVVASLTGNATFGTPLPTLVNMTAAANNVAAAIAKWGPPENRGSHADLLDLQTKAEILFNLLTAEADYVEQTCYLAGSTDYALVASLMITSGFEVKSERTPQGVLQMVTNLHVFVTRLVSANQVKIKWGKPLGLTSPGNVKSYNVFRSATNNFAAASIVGTTTKTSFIDTNDGVAATNLFYWIQPVGAAGPGVMSDVVAVVIPNIV